MGKTPYELWKNRKPNISYFYPFGCSCFILNTKENLNNFDSKAQKCIILGHFEHLKGYKVYNTETQIIMESIHINFDYKLDLEKSKLVDKFVDLEISYSDFEGKKYEVKDS